MKTAAARARRRLQVTISPSTIDKPTMPSITVGAGQKDSYVNGEGQRERVVATTVGEGSASDAALRTMFILTHDRHLTPSIMVETCQKDSDVKTQALVVENASGMCKAGFSGKDTLRTYFSIVSRPNRPRGQAPWKAWNRRTGMPATRR